MFGFLPSPCSSCQPDLASDYRAHFCGLSHEFAGTYGPVARFLTNRDSTFLSILAASFEPEESHESVFERCCNPIGSRRTMVAGWPSRYACAVAVCGAWTKLQDNVEDETGWRRTLSGIGLKQLQRWKQQAVSILMEADFPVAKVEQYFSEQEDRERANASWSDAAEPTALGYGEILAHSNRQSSSATLRKVGFHLGRLIYLWDAIVDREADLKRGRFSPLRRDTDFEASRDWLGRELDSMTSNYRQMGLTNPVIESVLVEGASEKVLPWIEGKDLAEIASEKKKKKRQPYTRETKWYDWCCDCCPCDCCDCTKSKGDCCDCDCCPCDCS